MASPLRNRFLIAGFCGSVSLICLWSAIAFHTQKSSGLPLSFSEILAHEALIEEGPQAIIKAQKAIEMAPARAITEIVMALALIKNEKKIGPKALFHIRNSYQKQPLSPRVHEPRLALIFSYWPAMPADIKLLAQEEAAQYARRESGRQYLKNLRPNLPSDAGFSLTLAMARGKIYNDMIAENNALLEDQ